MFFVPSGAGRTLRALGLPPSGMLRGPDGHRTAAGRFAAGFVGACA
ncbi:MAG: hypothetical protein JWR10_3251 [Rubritepida sp.]|nr:hypothetical protein [Rubritepida sp.]